MINCVDQSVRLSERDFGNGRRMLSSPTDGMQFGASFNFTFSLILEHTLKAGEQRMTTRRYTYSIIKAGTQDRIFAWHWHPESKSSRVKYPHVHVPQGSPYSTRHVPTGRITLEDVILFGFDELGVGPSVPEAVRIITEVRDKHKLHRGWS